MKTQIAKISPQEAKQRENVLWLDVRTPAEFTATHIEGSLLHPLHKLDSRKVKEHLKESQSCIIVCRTGNRAGQAAEKLAEAGVENLHVLDGGIEAWEQEDLPVNRGKGGVSLQRQVLMTAGSFVLTGTLLGIYVHAGFLGVPAFFGAGLLFAGITNNCALAMILARMPWNQRACGSPKSCSV